MKKSTLLPILIVCFSPAVSFLVLGSIMVPLQIYGIAGPSALHWEGPLGLIATIAGGIVGLIALFSLTIRVLRDREIDRPYLVVGGAVIGIASTLPMTAGGIVYAILFVLLPLFGTVWILIAGRHLLTPLIKPSIRPVIPAYIWIFGAIPVAVVAGLMSSRGALSHDDLIEKRQLWLQNMPASYSYDLHINGKLVQPPLHVAVDREHIVSAQHLSPDIRDNADSGYAPAITMAWTMTTIFDKLIEAQQQGKRVRALFDENSGSVKMASVTGSNGYYGWDLDAKNFAPN